MSFGVIDLIEEGKAIRIQINDQRQYQSVLERGLGIKRMHENKKTQKEWLVMAVSKNYIPEKAPLLLGTAWIGNRNTGGPLAIEFISDRVALSYSFTGSNDDVVWLYREDGNIVTLSAGETTFQARANGQTMEGKDLRHSMFSFNVERTTKDALVAAIAKERKESRERTAETIAKLLQGVGDVLGVAERLAEGGASGVQAPAGQPVAAKTKRITIQMTYSDGSTPINAFRPRVSCFWGLGNVFSANPEQSRGLFRVDVPESARTIDVEWNGVRRTFNVEREQSFRESFGKASLIGR